MAHGNGARRSATGAVVLENRVSGPLSVAALGYVPHGGAVDGENFPAAAACSCNGAQSGCLTAARSVSGFDDETLRARQFAAVAPHRCWRWGKFTGTIPF